MCLRKFTRFITWNHSKDLPASSREIRVNVKPIIVRPLKPQPTPSTCQNVREHMPGILLRKSTLNAVWGAKFTDETCSSISSPGVVFTEFLVFPVFFCLLDLEARCFCLSLSAKMVSDGHRTFPLEHGPSATLKASCSASNRYSIVSRPMLYPYTTERRMFVGISHGPTKYTLIVPLTSVRLLFQV